LSKITNIYSFSVIKTSAKSDPVGISEHPITVRKLEWCGKNLEDMFRNFDTK